MARLRVEFHFAHCSGLVQISQNIVTSQPSTVMCVLLT